MKSPSDFQQSEERFRRSLARFGWMQPLLTFIGLLALGLLVYSLSQTPEIDARFPSGFLLGLAGGFIATAISFYFYLAVFTRREERRVYFAKTSGARRRAAILAVRQQAVSDRQTVLLAQVDALSPGGLPTFQPQTRAQVAAMLEPLNGLIATLIDWDAIDEELTAALREFVQIQAEEGPQAELESALDQLLAFDVQRRQRARLGMEMQAAIQRLTALQPTLPDSAPSARSQPETGA